MAISSLISLMTALTHNILLVWVGTLFEGMFVAIAYSMLLTLFSDQVDSTEQGWVMGVTGSVMALCFGLATFFTGFAASINIAAPLLVSFSGLFIAAALMIFSKV